MKFLYKIIQIILSLFGVGVGLIFLIGLRLLWGPVDITSFLLMAKDSLGIPQGMSFEKAIIKYKGDSHPLYIDLQNVSFEEVTGTKGILKEAEVALNYKVLLTGHLAFHSIYLKNPAVFLQPKQEEIKEKTPFTLQDILEHPFFEELLIDFPEVTIEGGSFSYEIKEGTSLILPEYTLSFQRDTEHSLILIGFKAPTLTIEGETPFLFEKIDLKGTYHPKNKTFSFKESTVTWMEEVYAQFEAHLDLSDPEKCSFDIKGETGAVALDVFPKIWPSFLALSPRTWVIKNLSKGGVEKGTLHAQGIFSFPEQRIILSLLNGSLDLKDITVQYLEGLPPVEHVDGEATYTDKTFDIKIEKGVVSDVNVVEGDLFFSALDTDGEMAHIELSLQGPLKTCLWVIDHAPLSYPTKIGVHPFDFEGQANLKLVFDFPLLKDLSLNEVQLQATADLQELGYTQEFFGKPFVFSQGKGSLIVTKEDMQLKATGDLEGTPTSLQWNEIFKDSKSDFTLQGIYPMTILEKLGGDIGVEASGNFDLVLRLQKSNKALLKGSIKVDLTQTGFSVPLLQWVQEIGHKAKAEAAFSLSEDKNSLTLNAFTLTGTGIDLKGSLSFDLQEKTILKADFPLFNTPLGSINLSLNTLFKEGAPFYAIKVQGSSLDLSSFLEKSSTQEPEGEEKFSLKAKVDSLYFRKEYPIKNALLTLEKEGGRIQKLLLHGMFGDKKPVEILFGKRSKKTGDILRIHTSDAGEFFRAIDFYDDIEKGTLLIEGVRLEDTPEAFLKGKAHLKKFRLKETPIIAKILSLASLQGIADILGGKAVYFKSADLIFQVNDSILKIQKGLAESTATGVSLEGTVDRAHKTLSLKGTIIPVYILNAFIAHIPLLGDILSGGKDKGFWATSFSVTGSSASPKVSVNPLSALTPGFLRNIFDL